MDTALQDMEDLQKGLTAKNVGLAEGSDSGLVDFLSRVIPSVFPYRKPMYGTPRRKKPFTLYLDSFSLEPWW